MIMDNSGISHPVVCGSRGSLHTLDPIHVTCDTSRDLRDRAVDVRRSQYVRLEELTLGPSGSTMMGTLTEIVSVMLDSEIYLPGNPNPNPKFSNLYPCSPQKHCVSHNDKMRGQGRGTSSPDYNTYCNKHHNSVIIV